VAGDVLVREAVLCKICLGGELSELDIQGAQARHAKGEMLTAEALRYIYRDSAVKHSEASDIAIRRWRYPWTR